MVRRRVLGRLKSLLWAAVLGTTAAIAFWSFLRAGPSQETPSASDAAQMAAKESGEAKPIDMFAPSVLPAQPADSAQQADLIELRRLCGRPWVADFGPECLVALERRYGSTVPDRWPKWTVKWRPVMLGEPVTWADIFSRPAADLAAVVEAVQRPECLVLEGRFRLDLRQRCAADEMARLAILRRECIVSSSRLDRLEGRQGWWDIDQITVDHAEDQQEYYRRMARRSERWFGGMWRLAKCRALPEGALAAIGPFPAERHHRDFDPRLKHMMEAAARLGSDWALSSVLRQDPAILGNRTLRVDDAGIEDVRASRPVLAELLRMRRAEGVERTKHAIAAYMLGASLGVAVHPEGVEQITGPPDATWPAAAPKAARWLVEQGWTLVVDDDGELRRFERLEDVAEHQPWWDYWLERRVFVATNAPAEKSLDRSKSPVANIRR